MIKSLDSRYPDFTFTAHDNSYPELTRRLLSRVHIQLSQIKGPVEPTVKLDIECFNSKHVDVYVSNDYKQVIVNNDKKLYTL